MAKGIVRTNDLLAIIVIIFGASGIVLWGIGISSLGNPLLRWMGGVIIAFIGFIVALLSWWLK